MPTISVIMSVYNDAAYLVEAVDSILSQTFTDFEFIIVDDGSQDESRAILEDYDDARIQLLTNSQNIGLTRSLNRGVAVSTGQYIARQDSDDISASNRFEQQVAFLDAHPKAGLVGSWANVIDTDAHEVALFSPPSLHRLLKEELLYQNALCHGSVMFRQDAIQQVGSYNEAFTLAQDWDLWLRIAERWTVHNLPEPLYHMRSRATSLTRTRSNEQLHFGRRAVAAARCRRLEEGGLSAVSDHTLARHLFFLGTEYIAEGDLQAGIAYLLKVQKTEAVVRDADFILERLVYRARLTGDNAVSFIDTVLTYALPAGRDFEHCRRRAIGWYYAVETFSAQKKGWRWDVLRAGLTTLRHDRKWLNNRGFASMLIRAAMGIE